MAKDIDNITNTEETESAVQVTDEGTNTGKKGKRGKKKEKKPFSWKKFGRGVLIAVAVIVVLCGVAALVSYIGVQSNENFIETLTPVDYDGEQLEPTVDEYGYTTFVTDDDFKIVQLTDVHIGGGFLSIKKDSMAINAVAAMIQEEKPDLVIVTGDIAYPVPFQAGTFNNKTAAVMFADLMEQLGVYWCMSFGNHDTESYSYYTREEIAEAVYESGDYKYCLFESGPEDVDGVGNYVINVRNTAGEITQSLFMLDSHAYTDDNAFGLAWDYDCIHENQVEWYEAEVLAITEINGGETPKSLAFFHMPLAEYKEAWDEFAENDYEDTENVKYIYGNAGELDRVVYCSDDNFGFFDKIAELGSTQATFCGHDHLNNFSLEYKGIKLCYSYTIDYLAYTGIMKYGLQRGCTVITVSPDGSFTSSLENYYQDKYASTLEKETVTMENYYEDAHSFEDD